MDFRNSQELKILEDNLVDGLKIFKEIFGYSSKSFIAPSYVWDDNIERILKKFGVNYIQGIRQQFVPKIGRDKLSRSKKTA